MCRQTIDSVLDAGFRSRRVVPPRASANKVQCMSLLREIQNAASDSSFPIQDLLKKCLILGARLGHDPLREWATLELNGYPPGAELPRYRRVHVADVRAHVVLGLTHASNVSIARGAVPVDMQEDFYSADVRDPIAAVHDLVASDNELGIMVDAGLANHIVQRMYGDDMAGSISMRRVVGRSQFVALIDTVRTRILEFALEIEKLNEDAGDAPSGSAPLPLDKVQYVYNTTIMGGATNVAVGGTDVTQIAGDVKQGDWGSLESALRSIGIPGNDLAELKTALEEDEVEGAEGLGSRTRGWLEKIGIKAKSGGIALAGGVGTELIADLILKYLG